MRVFTKVNGQLACWQVDDLDYLEAIELVRSVVQAESGNEHKAAILALIKY